MPSGLVRSSELFARPVDPSAARAAGVRVPSTNTATHAHTHTHTHTDCDTHCGNTERQVPPATGGGKLVCKTEWNPQNINAPEFGLPGHRKDLIPPLTSDTWRIKCIRLYQIVSVYLQLNDQLICFYYILLSFFFPSRLPEIHCERALEAHRGDSMPFLDLYSTERCRILRDEKTIINSGSESVQSRKKQDSNQCMSKQYWTARCQIALELWEIVLELWRIDKKSQSGLASILQLYYTLGFRTDLNFTISSLFGCNKYGSNSVWFVKQFSVYNLSTFFGGLLRLAPWWNPQPQAPINVARQLLKICSDQIHSVLVLDSGLSWWGPNCPTVTWQISPCFVSSKLYNGSCDLWPFNAISKSGCKQLMQNRLIFNVRHHISSYHTTICFLERASSQVERDSYPSV